MINLLLIGFFSIFYVWEYKAVDGEKYRVTQYCLRGKTSSGQKVRVGGLAADRRIHPLGSKVRIAGKVYTVNDTGGMIKSRRLDIWNPSCRGSKQWGVKFLTVEKI